MLIDPIPFRHQLFKDDDQLTFIIPFPKYWFRLSALMVMVSILLLVGLAGILLLWSHELEELAKMWIGLTVMSIFWLYFLGLTTTTLLCLLLKKDFIRIDSQSLTVQSRLGPLPLGRAKTYQAPHIEALRFHAPEIKLVNNHYCRQQQDGWIAFDYGAKTIYFLNEVDAPEAKQILATIQQHFPQYQSQAAS